jgi:thiamine biosynthesis lipoprotein
VAAPYSETDELLAVLNLSSGGVATSGRDFRRWQQGGVSQHHLIDARTGRPAQTDVLSATVVAPTLWQAEMAAKRVFLSGGEAGLAWLEARPPLAGLICLEHGSPSVVTSRRLTDYLWD